MNQRIKELAKSVQCERHWTEEDIEKFAELIVRECAQRCEDIAIKNQVEETTYAAGKKAGAFECAADLKQHFGVEE